MKHNRIKFVGILTVLLFVTATQAAYMLPKSDYWHGAQNYYNSSNGVRAYVEYAVYKKIDGFPTAIAPLPSSATGDFLYAYMIANTDSTSLATVIATFQLIGAADISATTPTSVSFGSSCILPDNPTLSGKTITWEFAGGTFVYSKSSAYLIFTSKNAPTAGDIYLSNQLGKDAATPGSSTTTIPEPTTIALLSMGALLFRKVRRS
jgi:hypothetical protein